MSEVSEALEIFAGKNSLCKYVINETSLVMPDGASFDTIEGMLKGMKLVADSVRFWIGDLLVYSERNHGEMYSQLVDASDYSYQSLKDMMWVSGKLAPTVRRKELTWSHHREVAKLDVEKQRMYLQLAVRDNLSVAALHALINEAENPKEKSSMSKSVAYEAALKAILSDAKDSKLFNRKLFDERFEENEGIAPEQVTVTKMAIIAFDVLKAFKG